jgi:uracil phosphoribosyltransferase
MLTVFNETHSVLNRFIAELRDTRIQGDPMRFRKNIERIGQIMAYEISKYLAYGVAEIPTPLGTAVENTHLQEPVIACVLRAGLPLHMGVLSMFDRAENAFVSAYRNESEDGSLSFHVEYNASPSLDGKCLILCDPMLATGNSMILAYEALLRHGKPKTVHICAVIASRRGVENIRTYFGGDAKVWLGAVDPDLNHRSYIIPGLGDAGDLCFGEKQ